MIPLKDDNPASRFPVVTVGFVIANVFVFGYMTILGPVEAGTLVHRFSVVPARMFGDGAAAWMSAVYTPASSMFIHGGLLHIAGNMLFLWIFGDNVEDRFGHLGFLAFYLGCGVFAALAHAAAHPESTLPMAGASGAVSGVLGAYILMYPRARVWTLVFLIVFWRVVRIPAVVVIGLWILLQLVNAAAEFGRDGGGVAWFAHIGGFFAGVLLAWLFGRGVRRSGRGKGRASWRMT